MKNKPIHQAGFTLIELMVAIVLGLLISAAAVQIFINGTLSSRLQQGVSEVQDGGIFGLDMIAQHIQLANYGNPDNLALTDQTTNGGVIFTAGNASATNVNIKSLVSNAAIASDYLTKVSTVTNATTSSDQLTIQFVAPIDMSNCEGTKVFKGDLVVQRYFLRTYNAKDTDDTNVASLGLACDANTPATSAANVNKMPATLSGFGTTDSTGEVIIPRVDHMAVKFLAKIGTDYRYYTLAEYTAATQQARTNNTTVPEIQLIKIAVLVRSNEQINNRYINPAKNFPMLGTNILLKTASEGNANRFSREVYEISVALRNGYKE